MSETSETSDQENEADQAASSNEEQKRNPSQYPGWIISLRDVPIKVWLSVAGAVALPIGAVIAALASFAIGSINQRLASMEGQLSRQDTIVNARLESIADRIEAATQFEFDASDDMAEIRERLSSIEAQVSLSNEILFRADSPTIQREFLPVLTRVPVDFYGGGEGEAQPAEGFEDMVYTLPFPQNISDRDEAIELLSTTHLELLRSQSETLFDESRHELEISGRQVLLTDGTIQLELTSRVIVKLE